MGVWAVLVYVFLFLPIVFVVAHSFNGGRSFLVWDSFSTKPFSDFWEQRVAEARHPELAEGRRRAARSSPPCSAASPAWPWPGAAAAG